MKKKILTDEPKTLGDLENVIDEFIHGGEEEQH